MRTSRFGRPCSALLALIAVGASASADTFILKDGRLLDGDVVRENAAAIVIKNGANERQISRDELLDVRHEKSALDIFKARNPNCTTAEDFFQLGAWAELHKLKNAAKESYKKALSIDANHSAANTALGRVQYKGEWMTSEERDRRAAADEEAEMTAKGMVRFEGRWVTKEDRDKLEQGLVLYQGKWITKADAMKAQGLAEFDGRWIPIPEAIARNDVREASKAAGAELELALTDDCAIAGTFGAAFLAKIGAKLTLARAWFGAQFEIEPGLRILGDRRAEFYCFARDDKPYVATVPYFASLTKTLPSGWAAATEKTHGFYWFDPFALSSARLAYRNEDDLVGHCLHHWGHLLLNRDLYDGRLLPPWYDEAFACLAEYTVTKSNAVFCRAQREARVETGTVAKKLKEAPVADFDSATFHRGAWRDALKSALAKREIGDFEHLSGLQFNELGLTEIATGMAILEWLESTGPGALGRFHVAIHVGQPRGSRVDDDVNRRLACYDKAFQAACGKSLLQADQEWRAWVSTH